MRLRSLWFLVLWPTLAAAEPCPTTQYSTLGNQGVSAEPTGVASSFIPYPYSESAAVRWNAPLGWVQAEGGGVGHHGYGNGTVTTTDTFELSGATNGTSLNFTVAFVVYGDAYCNWQGCRYVDGSLADGSGNMGSLVSSELSVRRFELPLEMVVGSPLQLTYSLSVGGGGTYAGGQGWLQFPNLPPGLSVVSCRGFQAGAVTATRSTSWGRLKAHYR